MSLREAAQQALEALEAMAEGAEDECGEPNCGDCRAWRPVWAAMASLRAAMEQPEQGPCPTCVALARTVMMDQTGYDMPPRREWRGLTEEEIHDCFQQRHRDKAVERRMITRAIEAALRSKNHE